MKIVHIVIGVLALGLTGCAAAWGIWCWYRARSSRVFWWLLRAGQGFIVLEAVIGGVWEATAHHASELHLIYGLVPLAVSFLAEQLRIASAQMVLDSRGFESAAEVGELEPSEQRVIVLTIMQRELGVMVLAAVVMTVLLARAAGTG
ncbi:MAG TPA: hypothetical protein VFW09_18155 [Solirubrobacteraceae bacterium]|nr:hypothetical protein [Solirubrobacteraceae bacterium]